MQFILKNRLKDIVKLDSDKARILIENFNKENVENQAIEQLCEFPDLQYKLLEKIIQNKRKKQEEIG